MAKRMVYFTHYEYYPIYEPAEGGYYYQGTRMIACERMTLTQARKELKKAASYEINGYDGGYGWYKPDGSRVEGRYHGDQVIVAKRYVNCVGRYIGDGELFIIENEQTKGCLESGWVPYE